MVCIHSMYRFSSKADLAKLMCGFIACLTVLNSGCARQHRSDEVGISHIRNTIDAQQTNQNALAYIENGQWKEAEATLRDALQDDMLNAAAHNNLGLVLLEQSKYYEAAWEFQHAIKLAPGTPQPRANLALLFEEIGRFNMAMEKYEEALKLEPENFVTMRHLARTHVKAKREDTRFKDLLEKLFSIPNDQQWDYWIRGQLVRLGRVEPDKS